MIKCLTRPSIGLREQSFSLSGRGQESCGPVRRGPSPGSLPGRPPLPPRSHLDCLAARAVYKPVMASVHCISSGLEGLYLPHSWLPLPAGLRVSSRWDPLPQFTICLGPFHLIEAGCLTESPVSSKVVEIVLQQEPLWFLTH